MIANECHRCGSVVKDMKRHVKRVHPEASYMRPEEPPPHLMAQKITLEDQSYTREGYEVTYDEWKTDRYGWRQHGWFVPVEVEDNQEGMGDREWMNL